MNLQNFKLIIQKKFLKKNLKLLFKVLITYKNLIKKKFKILIRLVFNINKNNIKMKQKKLIKMIIKDPKLF